MMRIQPAASIRPAVAGVALSVIALVVALPVLASPPPTPGSAAKVGGVIDRALAAVGDELADALVKTKVRIALLEHLKSDGLRVQIDVHNGTVELSGAVQRRADQRLAESVAASVTGVRDVHNRITVAPGAEPTPPPVSRFVGKVERDLDDALLQAKVKARLLEEVGKVAFKIDVEATDGVVSLSGTVPDEERERLAVRTARATNGVKELHDLLKVAP
jgi:osmotically-inducible protein OsmY